MWLGAQAVYTVPALAKILEGQPTFRAEAMAIFVPQMPWFHVYL